LKSVVRMDLRTVKKTGAPRDEVPGWGTFAMARFVPDPASLRRV